MSIDYSLRDYFNAPRSVLNCTKEMVEVCAWCPDSKEGTEWGRVVFGKQVTHGICSLCLMRVLIELESLQGRSIPTCGPAS